jgi:hypothetical protein
VAILEDLADPVEGYAMKLAVGVHEPKGARIIGRKFHGLERNEDDAVFHAVEVAQLEMAAGKFGVPADPVQEFVDGRHGGDTNFQPQMNSDKHGRQMTNPVLATAFL